MLEENLQIRYVDLTFILEIECSGTLPRNKVSALRGGLGQMLLEQNFQINICKKGLENALFLRLSEGCCGNEEKPEWALTLAMKTYMYLQNCVEMKRSPNGH